MSHVVLISDRTQGYLKPDPLIPFSRQTEWLSRHHPALWAPHDLLTNFTMEQEGTQPLHYECLDAKPIGAKLCVVTADGQNLDSVVLSVIPNDLSPTQSTYTRRIHPTRVPGPIAQLAFQENIPLTSEGATGSDLNVLACRSLHSLDFISINEACETADRGCIAHLPLTSDFDWSPGAGTVSDRGVCLCRDGSLFEVTLEATGCRARKTVLPFTGCTTGIASCSRSSSISMHSKSCDPLCAFLPKHPTALAVSMGSCLHRMDLRGPLTRSSFYTSPLSDVFAVGCTHKEEYLIAAADAQNILMFDTRKLSQTPLLSWEHGFGKDLESRLLLRWWNNADSSEKAVVAVDGRSGLSVFCGYTTTGGGPWWVSRPGHLELCLNKGKNDNKEAPLVASDSSSLVSYAWQPGQQTMASHIQPPFRRLHPLSRLDLPRGTVGGRTVVTALKDSSLSNKSLSNKKWVRQRQLEKQGRGAVKVLLLEKKGGGTCPLDTVGLAVVNATSVVRLSSSGHSVISSIAEAGMKEMSDVRTLLPQHTEGDGDSSVAASPHPKAKRMKSVGVEEELHIVCRKDRTVVELPLHRRLFSKTASPVLLAKNSRALSTNSPGSLHWDDECISYQHGLTARELRNDGFRSRISAVPILNVAEAKGEKKAWLETECLQPAEARRRALEECLSPESVQTLAGRQDASCVDDGTRVSSGPPAYSGQGLFSMDEDWRDTKRWRVSANGVAFDKTQAAEDNNLSAHCELLQELKHEWSKC